MIATLPHVTSGSGLRKFQADGFLLDRVYLAGNTLLLGYKIHSVNAVQLRSSGGKHRVSIKSFPDYKHLLKENYVEYKHIYHY